MRLESERLYLCPWEPADCRGFTPNDGVPWTYGPSEEFVTRQRDRHERLGYCLWKLMGKTSLRLLGFCGIQPMAGTPDVEIGWWLAKDCWGKGLATEAATATMADGFGRCSLERIAAVAVPLDTVSRRVMEKLGMSYEADTTHKGEPAVRYAISRDTWSARIGAHRETARLLLCRWQPEDWRSLRPVTNDSDVLRFINYGVPWTDDQRQRFVNKQCRQYEQLGHCYWKLLDCATHRLIGFCGVQPLLDSAETEIGWWLAKDCWGRGLASEAARAALDDAFTRSGLQRVVALAMPDHRASRRIMEKLGMTYECNVVELGIDLALYAITSEKWSASGIGFAP